MAKVNWNWWLYFESFVWIQAFGVEFLSTHQAIKPNRIVNQIRTSVHKITEGEKLILRRFQTYFTSIIIFTGHSYKNNWKTTAYYTKSLTIYQLKGNKDGSLATCSFGGPVSGPVPGPLSPKRVITKCQNFFKLHTKPLPQKQCEMP